MLLVVVLVVLLTSAVVLVEATASAISQACQSRLQWYAKLITSISHVRQRWLKYHYAH
jgi:hypothetical protein